jgi:acetylornithine deacetylase/succinyl-diaminopimelate desuccinylase-like protein
MPLSAALVDYLERSRERRLVELADLLRFPSISALPLHREDVAACAAWLVEHLAGLGLENVRLLPTGGNPLVYGDWLHAGESSPTAVVYGHYDVQPADPEELWASPPFEPELRNGRLFARGASDNKGPIFVHLKAIEALLAVAGGLPCNVKVLIEGEEELQADNLRRAVAEHRDLLRADVSVISDACMYARGVPGLPLGLRGTAAVEITVRTAAGDLHSGLYGGAVPNALHVLARLVTTLHDPEDGRVLVEGFYDRVRPIDAGERAAWARLPFDEERFKSDLGLRDVVGERGYTTLERLWARPTLDLHGLWGGYSGEGLKTIVPAEAHATLSCRVVPDQDTEEVIQLLVRHLGERTPPHSSLSVDWTLAGSWPLVTRAEHPAARAALAALAEAYGVEPVVFRLGWAVPAAEILERVLDADSLLLGFALPEENAHAPNEHFHLENLEGGIRTMAAFWPRLARTLRVSVS